MPRRLLPGYFNSKPSLFLSALSRAFDPRKNATKGIPSRAIGIAGVRIYVPDRKNHLLGAANNEVLSISLSLESLLWRGTFRPDFTCGVFNEKYLGYSMELFVLRKLIKDRRKVRYYELINMQNFNSTSIHENVVWQSEKSCKNFGEEFTEQWFGFFTEWKFIFNIYINYSVVAGKMFEL